MRDEPLVSPANPIGTIEFPIKNVTIYPGANSTVGGNVFLIQSVPVNSLVIAEDVSVKVMKSRQPRYLKPHLAKLLVPRLLRCPLGV